MDVGSGPLGYVFNFLHFLEKVLTITFLCEMLFRLGMDVPRL